MSSSAFQPAITIQSCRFIVMYLIIFIYLIYRDRVTGGTVVAVQTQSHFCPTH